jgi:hypothetical protein
MPINHDSIQATSQLQFGSQFIRPAYGSYCFAHLPGTLKRLFGLPTPDSLPQASLPEGEYERVVLILLDAFGWQYFERFANELPLLRELVANGVASRLTSMFPSTTSAHITCLNTGLPVAQSGVYEWFYYEPVLDMVIAPLLFSPAGEKGRDLLAQQGAKPADIFPNHTLYQDLAQGGVRSYLFTPIEYSRSVYNTHVTQGAEVLPYITWSEALTNLELLLEKDTDPTYAYLYFSGLDAIGHPHGPDAPHTANELISVLLILERFLDQLRLAASQKRTLLLVTADHGIAYTDIRTTYYLNQRLPDIIQHLKRDRQGKPILFGGSPRDLFLYVQDDRLPLVQSMLQKALAGIAEVHTTQALRQAGIFGPEPLNPALLERLGNLVILPYPGHGVSMYVKDKFENKYYGHHGGLTPDEMLIPLLAYPLA